MVKTAVVVPEEQDFILSSLSPGRAQRRLALAVVLVFLVALFIGEGPLSTTQAARIDAFVPAYAAAMFVTDLITAVLLFAQFSILRSPALLAISSGYLFTALILIPWTLTFPGIFTPGGLLGAGLQQSTHWLYILWHAGFPMWVIAYALLKDADPAKRLWQGSVGAAILSSIAVTTAVVCAATFLVTAGDAQMPRIALDAVRFSPLWFYAAGGLALLSVLALVVLWIRRRSVLDLWLMVVMCAYLTELCLITFPVPVRFSVGWYAARFCGFLAGNLVLFVLLYEITTLYAMVRAARLEEALQEAKVVGDNIAHDLRTPLTRGRIRLERGREHASTLEELRAVADQAIAGLDQSLTTITALLRITEIEHSRRREGFSKVQLAPLIRAAADLYDPIAENKGVTLRVEAPDGAAVRGDRDLLFEAVANLVDNAVKFTPQGGRVEIALLCQEGETVIRVSDSGPGISETEREAVTQRFYRSDKSRNIKGLGLGLSMVAAIIKLHGFRFSISAGPGCTVEIACPHAD